jgi:hypothetical protein
MEFDGQDRAAAPGAEEWAKPLTAAQIGMQGAQKAGRGPWLSATLVIGHANNKVIVGQI